MWTFEDEDYYDVGYGGVDGNDGGDNHNDWSNYDTIKSDDNDDDLSVDSVVKMQTTLEMLINTMMNMILMLMIGVDPDL